MEGKTLSHYSILKLLGSGGMGQVYLAQDHHLDRTVALKVLSPEMASDRRQMERFIQEARAASSLKHPNVAHIYEIGDSGTIHFIAMEHVDGITLDSKINHCPLETEEIVDIAIQVVDGLDEAHSKGVIHRDIKSQNIMVTPRGQAKILDFGLAKIIRPVVPEGSTDVHTDAGVIMGSVHSMSPEQAMGKQIDHRTDIFSLGVVLYQMTTGRIPFPGETITEVLSRILHSEPDAIARFNYDAPQELDRIIRKCLEKDPSRRYQTMREVLVDFRNLKRDLASGTANKPSTKRPALLLPALATFLLLVAAVAIILYTPRSGKQDDRIRSLAVLPFENEGGKEGGDYISDGITEGVINSLGNVKNFKIMARSTVFRYKGKPMDPRQIGKELDVQSVLVGSVLRSEQGLNVKVELVNVRDGSLIWGQSYRLRTTEIPTIHSTIAMEISRNLVLGLSSKEQKQVARSYTANPEAYELYLKGRFHWNKRRTEGFAKGIEYFRQAVQKDPGYALPYAGLADSYDLISYYGLRPASEVMPLAKAAALRAIEIDDSLAEAHASLGDIKYFFERDWSGAEKEFLRAIELNPNYSNAHHWYGLYLVAMERTKEAEEHVRKGQELDPLSLSNNAGYIRQLYFAHRYDDAIHQHKKTMELDPTDLYAAILLGLVYIQKGRFDEAVELFRSCDAAANKSVLTRGALAYALAVSSNKDEALALQQELEALSKTEYVPPFYMAVVFTGLGRADEAFHYLDLANEEKDGQLVFLKVEPIFDPLRSDPRFAALLQKVGLPE